jgi:hypothetical protein
VVTIATRREFVIPAKAEIHRSAARAFATVVPAVAGTTIKIPAA